MCKMGKNDIYYVQNVCNKKKIYIMCKMCAINVLFVYDFFPLDFDESEVPIENMLM